RLHRKISRLFALEDAIDVAGRLPELVDGIGTVGDQAAAVDELACEVDRGQFVPRGERDEQIAVSRRQRASSYDQTAIRSAREGRDAVLDRGCLAHIARPPLDPKRGRRCLNGAPRAAPGG